MYNIDLVTSSGMSSLCEPSKDTPALTLETWKNSTAKIHMAISTSYLQMSTCTLNAAGTR